MDNDNVQGGIALWLLAGLLLLQACDALGDRSCRHQFPRLLLDAPLDLAVGQALPLVPPPPGAMLVPGVLPATLHLEHVLFNGQYVGKSPQDHPYSGIASRCDLGVPAAQLAEQFLLVLGEMFVECENSVRALQVNLTAPVG